MKRMVLACVDGSLEIWTNSYHLSHFHHYWRSSGYPNWSYRNHSHPKRKKQKMKRRRRKRKLEISLYKEHKNRNIGSSSQYFSKSSDIALWLRDRERRRWCPEAFCLLPCLFRWRASSRLCLLIWGEKGITIEEKKISIQQCKFFQFFLVSEEAPLHFSSAENHIGRTGDITSFLESCRGGGGGSGSTRSHIQAEE